MLVELVKSGRSMPRSSRTAWIARRASRRRISRGRPDMSIEMPRRTRPGPACLAVRPRTDRSGWPTPPRPRRRDGRYRQAPRAGAMSGRRESDGSASGRDVHPHCSVHRRTGPPVRSRSTAARGGAIRAAGAAGYSALPVCGRPSRDAGRSARPGQFLPRANSRQAGDARAARRAHQERLRLVVGVMRGQQDRRARIDGPSRELQIARLACAHLDAAAGNRRGRVKRAMRHAERRAPGRDHRRLLGRRRAQAMIDGRRDDPVRKGGRGERQHHHAVGSARNGKCDPFVRFRRSAQRRCEIAPEAIGGGVECAHAPMLNSIPARGIPAKWHRAGWRRAGMPRRRRSFAFRRGYGRGRCRPSSCR